MIDSMYFQLLWEIRRVLLVYALDAIKIMHVILEISRRHEHVFIKRRYRSKLRFCHRGCRWQQNKNASNSQGYSVNPILITAAEDKNIESTHFLYNLQKLSLGTLYGRWVCIILQLNIVMKLLSPAFSRYLRISPSKCWDLWLEGKINSFAYVN